MRLLMSEETPDLPSPPRARIQDLPAAERPREKMLRQGPGALSDAELLAIFFGSGVVGMSAVGLGQRFMQKYGTLHALSRLSAAELQEQKGVGEAKALHLAAAFELGKRLARETTARIPMNTPEAVVNLIGPELRAEPQEVLKVMLLNTRLALMGVEEITRGTVNETIAHPRDVLHHVIRRRAHSFLIVHNHPAGDPQPSAADRSFTRRLREAADLMQVAFLDHIIIGLPSGTCPGYFSFRETGMM
jgi:DNA repair protein RadC